MPGPWSDEMRSLSQCSLAPAAVAEDPERRCWGAPWALGVTILTKRPIRFPRIYSYSRLHMNSCPLPRQDASDRQDAPGGGTLVGEDSLRESGLRPLSHPSSQNQQDCRCRDNRIPERTHAVPGKAPRQGISSSRVEADCMMILNPSRPIRLSACGKVVEYAICCGLRWKSW